MLCVASRASQSRSSGIWPRLHRPEIASLRWEFPKGAQAEQGHMPGHMPRAAKRAPFPSVSVSAGASCSAWLQGTQARVSSKNLIRARPDFGRGSIALELLPQISREAQARQGWQSGLPSVSFSAKARWFARLRGHLSRVCPASRRGFIPKGCCPSDFPRER